MRNPFARLAKRDIARPSLRERLNATKAKAKMVLTVNRTLVKVSPAPDPILAMIEEGRRLMRAHLDVHQTVEQDPATLDPPSEWGAAGSLLWAHVDNIILKTVPRTAVGCRELARFAGEVAEHEGVPISDDEQAIYSLIARSPLL